MKKFLLSVVIILYLYAQCSGVYAQGISNLSPGATQERSRDTREYYGLEERLKREKERLVPEEDRIVDETKVPEKIPPTLLPDEKVIFVKRIITNRSEILPDGEVRRITRRYESMKVSIKDLHEAVSKINKLYKTKEFIIARAVLPPAKGRGWGR